MSIEKGPLVTVVIPTYNRIAVLRQTLACLAGQNLPADQVEVCIVDDGSSDKLMALADEPFPFALRCLQRNRQGATAARNAGALEARGEVLVFMDDDICPGPQTLAMLVQGCQGDKHTIMLGTLITPEASKSSVFGRLNAPSPYAAQATAHDRDVPATDCLTGLLAVRRESFLDLGMFQDPTGGWPNWDDVDFGYRAQQAGYRLHRSALARAEHWDYATADLATMCRRMERASHSAARLLRKYPALEPAMPMFADKGPIGWGVDSPSQVLRKLLRRVASMVSVVSVLEWLAHELEQRWPAEPILRRLYRWIIGAYIFRGFQAGVKEIRCSTP